MGMCFSKKKKEQQQQQPLSPPPLNKREEEEEEKKKNVVVVVEEEQLVITKESRTATKTNARLARAEKKPVFVIAVAAQKVKSTPSVSAASSNSSKEEEEEEEEKRAYVGLVENNGESNNEKPAPGVRTSSCSKEEVDAILIQCGRLSRSSSNRRYSGSKRSYDFDNDNGRGREDDDDFEKLPMPRPSPRRRTPSRERAASGGGGGSRRVSRSPGRRVSDGPAYSSASDKPRQNQQQQPGKMVSVPAREKGGGTARRASAASAAAAATSRSNSPAKNARMVVMSEPQSLSRSNSRKAEQSPLRRNPMAEIDDNSVRPSQSNTNRPAQKIGRDGEEAIRKTSHVNNNQRSSDRRSGGGASGGSMDVPKRTRSSSNTISNNCVREQLMSCRPKEKMPPETVEADDVTEATKLVAAAAAAAKTSTDQENQNNPRAVTRSRRSSKDFDAANPTASSYASLLLEDIQNYHQQNTGFSLPACLSKARSILEAVADLNSSSSSSFSSGQVNGGGGDNVRLGRGTFVSREPMVESEIVVEDDLTEPSLHKYISEMEEPQESAGSNSFVGGQPWEPNSVGSTDRHWVDDDGERLSGGGGVFSASNSLPSGQLLRRGGGGGGGRGDCSLPVAVAAASATS